MHITQLLSKITWWQRKVTDMFQGNTYNVLDVLNNIHFNVIQASSTFFKAISTFAYFIFRNWVKIKSINGIVWNAIWWFIIWWWNRLGLGLYDIDKEIVKFIAYHITSINNNSIATGLGSIPFFSIQFQFQFLYVQFQFQFQFLWDENSNSNSNSFLSIPIPIPIPFYQFLFNSFLKPN